MGFGDDWMAETLKLNIHPPAHHVPGFANVTKLSGSGAAVAILSGKPCPPNTRCVGKDNIPRTDHAKKIIMTIARAIPLELGGPNVASFKFMAKGLLVVHPPKFHASGELMLLPLFHTW